jgi:phenylpropionate dioxygenase-like ring-hydroxylating dioxygenase large terminal subunit
MVDLSDYEFQPDLSSASTLPARWYTDPGILALERRRIFTRCWQPAGHAASVVTPGSLLACDLAGEPVLLTRAPDGELRAMSNVCRHRGSELCTGHGQANVIRCPYHGWTYTLDGGLHGAPEFEGVRDWDRAAVRLPQFRAETWGPYVFACQDPAAPALAEVFGRIPAETAALGCPLEGLRFSARRDYVIECNWKIYVDNYLEGYHLPAAHPSLFRELDYARYRVETFRYYSSQIAPIKARGTGENASPRRYTYADDSQQALYYWVFPNYMLNIYPDNLSLNVIVPLGPDKTLTIFEWFSYGDTPVAQETIDFSDEIQQEDIRICESVQRGLRSLHYDRGRFSVKRENGVHHFHGLVAEFLNRPESKTAPQPPQTPPEPR